MCAISKAPLLSVSNNRSCRSSLIIAPSWYFVAGLLSILSDTGRLTTGIRNSSASEANHVSTLAPVSAAIYSASVDEWVTVACLADAHTIGCFMAKTSSPVIDRLVSLSAAYSESV